MRPSGDDGTEFLRFVHPEDLWDLMESFESSLAGHLAPHGFRVLTKSGDVIRARSSSQPVVEGGELAGLRGVTAEVTERRLGGGEVQVPEHP
ncbi:MAG: PAS domain-containing protein [Thermodesulfobacteriota bacterium]